MGNDQDGRSHRETARSIRTETRTDRVEQVGAADGHTQFSKPLVTNGDTSLSATGDDASARLELSEGADYDTSTRVQLCTVRSWSSDRVSAVLRQGSLDSVENAAVHLTAADETQVVSMKMN